MHPPIAKPPVPPLILTNIGCGKNPFITTATATVRLVIESGIMLRSRSIPEAASNAPTSQRCRPRVTQSLIPAPEASTGISERIPITIYATKTSVNTTAVISSTSGYTPEMLLPQSRQRLPSSSQLTIGMLSYHAIGCLHFGQCDPGRTIDICRGSLWISTFRKLPTQLPIMKTNTPKITAMKVSQRPPFSSWPLVLYPPGTSSASTNGILHPCISRRTHSVYPCIHF